MFEIMVNTVSWIYKDVLEDMLTVLVSLLDRRGDLSSQYLPV